jgi:hypothetical protein
MFGRKAKVERALVKGDTRHEPEPLLAPDDSHVYLCAEGYTPSKPVEASPYNDGGKLAAECTMQYVHDEVYQTLVQSRDELPEEYPTLTDAWDLTHCTLPRRAIELLYDGYEVIITFEVVMDPDLQRPEEDEDGEEA